MTDLLQMLDAVELVLQNVVDNGGYEGKAGKQLAQARLIYIPEIRAALEVRENKLPASYDIIIQAINEYTGYMLDDDYDAPAMLNKIMNKIIDRAQLHGIIPTPSKGGSDGHN